MKAPRSSSHHNDLTLSIQGDAWGGHISISRVSISEWLISLVSVLSHPYLEASSRASSSLTNRWSSRSHLFPHSTMSGFSQYACICSWPANKNTHLCLAATVYDLTINHSQKPETALVWNILIQFLTLRKLCSFVRSNSRRKPIASLKKAVVRLLNLCKWK